MQCPHCLVSIHEDENRANLATDLTGRWLSSYQICPSCEHIIVHLIHAERAGAKFVQSEKFLAYPRNATRPKAPTDVLDHIAEDFNEACLIVNDSPKASAALSRRCLQTILRETMGVKKGSLDNEIDQAMELFPSHIFEAIDAIRHIGNFAAHPIKSTSTGEIVAVEPGESEWLLDVLEQLFDFCYVQPRILKEKRDKLNAKLKDAGKPMLKTKTETLA